jgi:hypothetical protein
MRIGRPLEIRDRLHLARRFARLQAFLPLFFDVFRLAKRHVPALGAFRALLPLHVDPAREKHGLALERRFAADNQVVLPLLGGLAALFIPLADLCQAFQPLVLADNANLARVR